MILCSLTSSASMLPCCCRTDPEAAAAAPAADASAAGPLPEGKLSAHYFASPCEAKCCWMLRFRNSCLPPDGGFGPYSKGKHPRAA